MGLLPCYVDASKDIQLVLIEFSSGVESQGNVYGSPRSVFLLSPIRPFHSTFSAGRVNVRTPLGGESKRRLPVLPHEISNLRPSLCSSCIINQWPHLLNQSGPVQALRLVTKTQSL